MIVVSLVCSDIQSVGFLRPSARTKSETETISPSWRWNEHCLYHPPVSPLICAVLFDQQQGLFIWTKLLSCWPSLVTRLTCLLKELKLLTKPSRRPTHLTRVRCCWPGLTPNPIHRALKMCADPSIQASPFQKVNVAWCAKHKGYCLDEALQSCLYLRSALAAPRKSQASFSNKVV